jgi:Ca2+-transporting ATPase
VFNFRALHTPLAWSHFVGNPFLLAAVVAMAALQFAAVGVPFLRDVLGTVPLEAAAWGLLVAVALPLFGVPEGLKRLRWKRG